MAAVAGKDRLRSIEVAKRYEMGELFALLRTRRFGHIVRSDENEI